MAAPGVMEKTLRAERAEDGRGWFWGWMLKDCFFLFNKTSFLFSYNMFKRVIVLVFVQHLCLKKIGKTQMFWIIFWFGDFLLMRGCSSFWCFLFFELYIYICLGLFV